MIGIEIKLDFLGKQVNKMILLGLGSNLNSSFGDRFENINLYKLKN